MIQLYSSKSQSKQTLERSREGTGASELDQIENKTEGGRVISSHLEVGVFVDRTSGGDGHHP